MDKLFGNDWSYANKATCDRHTDAENLLAAIDSLQLAEAANRNAIAVAQLTIKYVREERQALVEQNGRIFQQLNTAEARAGELELQAVSLRTVISTICDRIGAERSFDEILSGQRIMAWIDSLTSPLPEASQAKPVAWVPLHPRTGPLWANTTANLELDRPIYPLMALYASPLPADATGPYGDGSMCQDCPPFGSYNLKRCQWCPRKSFAQPQGE
jgi:hypothetical protein